MNSIVLFHKGLPPSSNQIYYNRSGGGRGLSAEGQTFKNHFVPWLASHLITRKQLTFDRETPYAIELVFLMYDAINGTWPRRAKNKFKKIDLDNQLKLVMDAISTAIDVDDSAFFSLTVAKCVPPPYADEGILIKIYEHVDISLSAIVSWAAETEDVLFKD